MTRYDAIRVQRLNDGAAITPFPAETLFAQAAAQARIGAWSCHLTDHALSWTEGVYDLFGLSPTRRADRRETVELYEEESRETMERLRCLAITQGRPFTMEAQIIRPDGTARWMRLSTDVVRDNGRITQLFGLKQDITDEKARWDALRQLAEHDPLTGLKNRAVFQSAFLDASRAQPRYAPLGALALFDLDGFKQINDRHGHAAGDACLRVVAQRLQAAFYDAPLVARIGGDEFAVLINAAPSTVAMPLAALKRRMTRVLAELSRPIPWSRRVLTVGASAGIALTADPHRYDADALFTMADEALYASKAAGRGAVRISEGYDIGAGLAFG
jgi:diguanylate cyclase (GGDEF)-like protein/PAS domain S-box-containing protein